MAANGKGGLLTGKRVLGESGRQVRYCNEYLLLPPHKRSILALYERCKADPILTDVPARTTLQTWYHRFDWKGRADKHDRAIERKRARAQEQTMLVGLATPARRVRTLKYLSARLLQEFDKGMLWLDRKKTVGDKEVITEIQYNSALINDIRGLLDDIARETGGRNPTKHVEFKGLAYMLAEHFHHVDNIGDSPIDDGEIIP